MNIDYNKLKTFTIVAQYGQISSAAEYLHRSQPAITKQIQILEDELQIQLLERRKGKVKLTPQGEEIYEYSKNIFAQLDKKLISFQKEIEEPEGLIKIVTLNDHGNQFPIEKCIAQFQKRYPAVQIEIDYGTNSSIEDDLIEGKYDLGLSVIFRKQKFFQKWPISKDKHNLYTSKNYFKEINKTKSVKDILQYSLIDLSNDFTSISPWIKKNYPSSIPRLKHRKPSITAPDFRAIRKILLEDGGIAILPEYLAGEKDAKNKLIKVFNNSKATTSGLDLAVRNHKTLRACEREFVKFAKEFI